MITIVFNANGGSVNPTSRQYEKNKSYGYLPTPTRSGYTFLGWYTAANGGSMVTTGSTATVSRTLYAHWG